MTHDDDLIRRGDALALTRYDPALKGVREDWAGMVADDDGDWVSFDEIAALPAVTPVVLTTLLGLRSIVRKAATDAREVFEGRKRATEAIGYMEQLILAATLTDTLDTPAPAPDVAGLVEAAKGIAPLVDVDIASEPDDQSIGWQTIDPQKGNEPIPVTFGQVRAFFAALAAMEGK